jgi:serine/threonine protein kinase
MDPDAITLFRELADRSPSEREEYYAQRQVPHALREAVESLLRFDSVTDSLADRVASAAANALFKDSQQDNTTTRAAIDPPRSAIGRYEVVRLLGRGGMSEVFLARDPVLDREIAVKLIQSSLDDDTARRRLVQEARAAGRLRHPNIVTIFDAGEHDGRSYIAMEYVRGETLGNLIRRRADLSLRRRLELIEDACTGLAHAHRAGVIHLDIKPDNLMLDETGVVKVLDFGIARVLHGDSLFTRHLAGTLRYMSPEQIEGRSLDRRSDVFSLGCSLFEIVAYAPAYAGSTKEIITRITAGPVPRLLDAMPNIDPRLDVIASRAMAVDPTERYQDLEELGTDLHGLRGEIVAHNEGHVSQAHTISGGHSRATPTQAGSQRSPSTHQSPSSRRLRLAASIGAATLIAGGIAAFLMFGDGSAADPPAPAAGQIPTTALPATARPVEPTVPEAKPGNEEVWRRLAIGDREGVLQLLQASTSSAASQDMPLASNVLKAVRTSVLLARQTATGPAGSASVKPYRSAEEQLARANRLEANGRLIEALGALWQAADLYTQSTAISQRQPSRGTPEPPAPTFEEAATVAGRAAALPTPPAVELPRPEPVAPPVAETTSAERPASAAPDPPRASSDVDAILDALRRYQHAYSTLDVAGVLQVFPLLERNQVEQLRRTFAGMTAYEIDFRNTRVTARTDAAIVQATVVRRMVPRVGNPVANEVETEFRLRRDDTRWLITAVTAR